MSDKQNKYPNNSECKVFQFPTKTKNEPRKQTLTDSEINSLFMGLVKLAKENSTHHKNAELDVFLEQSALQKRKELLAKNQNQRRLPRL